MDFSKLDGLIPAVVQDHLSGDVLMVGFMNPEAWEITRRTGYVTFFSRTRNTLWTKGETSGNKLAVRDVFIDCDEDTVLVKAERLGEQTGAVVKNRVKRIPFATMPSSTGVETSLVP